MDVIYVVVIYNTRITSIKKRYCLDAFMLMYKLAYAKLIRALILHQQVYLHL